MTVQLWINVVALIAGTVAGGVWLVLYLAKVSGWWREEHRAHVVAFSGIVWIFYALYTYRTLTSPLNSPGAAPSTFNSIRTGLFVLLTVVIVWRLFIFLRGLRRKRILKRNT